jgi:hypothetical protein
MRSGNRLLLEPRQGFKDNRNHKVKVCKELAFLDKNLSLLPLLLKDTTINKFYLRIRRTNFSKNKLWNRGESQLQVPFTL